MNTLVDSRLGNSYQVVKEVHAALGQILFVADNMSLLAPRDIELQESPDQQYLQWRREGDPAWTNLVSLADLAKGLIFPPGTTFGIPEPADAVKAYARSKGAWVEALAADRVGEINGVAALGADGKVPGNQLPPIPAAQVPADWDATSGTTRILNKPTIPAAQVQSDWNAANGMGAILNKPDVLLASKLGAINGVAQLGADGKVPAAQLPASSGSGSGGFTPRKIAAGTTYFVPDDSQAFLRMAITVDGTLKLDGYLIEV
jgi:hypothetical protein